MIFAHLGAVFEVFFRVFYIDNYCFCVGLYFFWEFYSIFFLTRNESFLMIFANLGTVFEVF
jgi:hypothetical protein